MPVRLSHPRSRDSQDQKTFLAPSMTSIRSIKPPTTIKPASLKPQAGRDRGYKSEIIRPEIQKVNLINRNNLLKKRPKHQEDSITLVLTFHPALNTVFDVLKRAHQHVQKSPVLKAVLPKPAHIAFRNPKTLRDKLVRSKLKLTDDAERGNFPCGRGN